MYYCINIYLNAKKERINFFKKILQKIKYYLYKCLTCVCLYKSVAITWTVLVYRIDYVH
jgi:hypothetical protein